MLPIQRYVFISSRGPISDSPVIMAFMLEVDRGHEVLLTASAEISESKFHLFVSGVKSRE